MAQFNPSATVHSRKGCLHDNKLRSLLRFNFAATRGSIHKDAHTSGTGISLWVPLLRRLHLTKVELVNVHHLSVFVHILISMPSAS